MELVEPEAVHVKEEKVEPNGSEEEKAEPDVQLIGEDGEYAIQKIRKKKRIGHIRALKVFFFSLLRCGGLYPFWSCRIHPGTSGQPVHFLPAPEPVRDSKQEDEA